MTGGSVTGASMGAVAVGVGVGMDRPRAGGRSDRGYGRASRLGPAMSPTIEPPRSPVVARRDAAVLTLELVREVVLRCYGITRREFMGRGRHPTVVEARGVFVVLCRRTRNLRVSYPEITVAMRGEDVSHTTAITAMRRMERLLDGEGPGDGVEADRVRRNVEAVQHALDLERKRLGVPGAGYRVEGELVEGERVGYQR